MRQSPALSPAATSLLSSRVESSTPLDTTPIAGSAAEAMKRKTPVAKKLYRMEELVAMGFGSRASIYKRIRAGQFPPPIRLGPNSVAWIRENVEEWLEERALSAAASVNSRRNSNSKGKGKNSY
jgi:prophage regulatory protein